jgi:hypothetical protein
VRACACVGVCVRACVRVRLYVCVCVCVPLQFVKSDGIGTLRVFVDDMTTAVSLPRSISAPPSLPPSLSISLPLSSVLRMCSFREWGWGGWGGRPPCDGGGVPSDMQTHTHTHTHTLHPILLLPSCDQSFLSFSCTFTFTLCPAIGSLSLSRSLSRARARKREREKRRSDTCLRPNSAYVRPSVCPSATHTHTHTHAQTHTHR